MFKTGKRKKQLTPGGERLVLLLARKLEQVQQGWTRVMNNVFNGMGLKSRWIALICFMILMVALSGYVSISALTNDIKAAPANYSIKVPQTSGIYREEHRDGVPDKVYGRIHGFRMSLDSMGNTAEGRVKRDSLVRSRPGLMDSLVTIEKYYQQLKNP
ncbi:hypothetical protein [Pedobacter sp. GR22-10]|uniref:hypothetical protein n=1 Tax=Pedobacter sp. GR22-10 TaxID=2994472 RepID=UPI0022458AB9|nr:hypothetical protein [Pedobacter sp. GR22-10]MCX2429923.1 hypothetical protein [Pedobacter sp. GR22-10]